MERVRNGDDNIELEEELRFLLDFGDSDHDTASITSSMEGDNPDERIFFESEED